MKNKKTDLNLKEVIKIRNIIPYSKNKEYQKKINRK